MNVYDFGIFSTTADAEPVRELGLWNVPAYPEIAELSSYMMYREGVTFAKALGHLSVHGSALWASRTYNEQQAIKYVTFSVVDYVLDRMPNSRTDWGLVKNLALLGFVCFTKDRSTAKMAATGIDWGYDPI